MSKYYNEKELWGLFRNGNDEAFSDLYRKCYSRLYAYGIRYGMEPQNAEDAIQDIFFRLYRRPELVRSTDTLIPFMYASVRYYWFNLLKKNGKMDNLEDMSAGFNFTYTIEEAILDREDREAVRQRVDRLVGCLTPRQKEIVYLRFFLGLDYDGISSVLNLSHQTARNLLHKAIKSLREKDAEAIKLLLFVATAFHADA